MSFIRSLQFLNDGGPVVILPRAALGDWHGQPPDTDDVPAGDYERACEVQQQVGLLSAGNSTAVVTNTVEHFHPIEWLHRPGEETLYLVGHHYGDEGSDAALHAALEREEPKAWHRLGDDLPAADLILFHAAMGGDENNELPSNATRAVIGDALPAPFSLPAASVDWVDLANEPGAFVEWQVTVIRWQPIGAA
jgi:hypothetical protein